MNKASLSAAVGIITLAATSGGFAAMSVTLLDNTAQYSFGVGGEFRAVGNAGLNSAVNWSAYSAQTSGTIGVGDHGSWGWPSAGVHDLDRYFQTFCIEYNEEFNPGTTYNVGISPNARYGSNPPNGDPVSIGTAWLYSQFAGGSLSGYNYAYGGTRTPSAGGLQVAIWWLEGEATGTRNSFIDTAEVALYGAGHTGGIYDTMIKGDANGAYGVRALNLGEPGLVQDQLVIVPEPTTMVAGALLLLPFGLSTIRILRKKA